MRLYVAMLLCCSGCFAPTLYDLRSATHRPSCTSALPVSHGTLLTDPRNNYDSVDHPYREYAGHADTSFYAMLPGTVVRVDVGKFDSRVEIDSPNPNPKGPPLRVIYHVGGHEKEGLLVESGSAVVAGQYLGTFGPSAGWREGPSLRIEMKTPTCGYVGPCYINPAPLLRQAQYCEQGEPLPAIPPRPTIARAKKPPTRRPPRR